MRGTYIHPTAVIEKGAQLGENVHIGPFCVISSEAQLGDDCVLQAHSVILGATFIGAGARVSPHAILGDLPQNNKHSGARTTLEIGKNCIIREGVTMHRGSDNSVGRTIVGDNCLFLAYAHVAHDSVIGNHVTFSNNVMIGGHVVIGDHVIIGGGAAVHQLVRVGHHAFIGGVTALTKDLIPYGSAVGVHAWLGGLNIIGMKRSGLARADIHIMRHAVVMLFDKTKPVRERAADLLNVYPDSVAVADLAAFVRTEGRRALCTPGRNFEATEPV
ncbi:MAG: acyl-[acyl-carrier-protein]--UDP-N-acetylglucosamine O-acyltransferase [Candidatus Tokpelaia sp.]|nr:MAG: acyl-[acyl-carrier-protein]--UDP-N-acetylglucosamine O-acyltransferase [Candidatus Tokpelaia sp.]KAA6207841.1 MAG: acyl-[acyl-carrier-protein]--UDP-N-acetylglucosamine O-acyltransferase [Candidatus Tokpelaia sp.]